MILKTRCFSILERPHPASVLPHHEHDSCRASSPPEEEREKRCCSGRSRAGAVVRLFAGVGIFLSALANGLAAEVASSAQAKEGELLSLLRSDTAPQDKAIACKQLAVYGTEKAVPVLAPLLSDERLASWARIPLEAIPGPAADEVLRQAMGKLKGRLLIGTINSIA